MKEYNLFIGLGGSFGGAKYYDTLVFNSEDEAWEYAYQLAIEEYQKYEGLYGLIGLCDVTIDYCKDENKNINDLSKIDLDIIDEIYYEKVDKWIEYYVKEHNEE